MKQLALVLLVCVSACTGDKPRKATCEQVAYKLNELSRVEASAAGRDWTDEKAKKKADDFVGKCSTDLANGKLTQDKLDCALAGTDLRASVGCLR